MTEIEEATFDYTKVAHRQSPFAEYLKETLVPLLRNARWLQQFHEQLLERCDGLTYQTVQDDGDYERALLGGVNAGGGFNEQSFAKVFREFFGLRFSDHDEAVATASAGGTIQTEVIVEETAATELIDEIVDHGEAIVEEVQAIMADWPQQADPLPKITRGNDFRVPEPEYRSLLTDPDALIERFSEFIEAIQSVLPNYDERAFFLLTLDHTPRFYLEEAYPGLKSPYWWGVDDSEELREHYEALFGLSPVFTPDIEEDTKENERVRRNYTLYSYESGSIGARLLDLYTSLWDAFETDRDNEPIGPVREAVDTLFTDLPDYKQSFRERAERSLDEMGEWTRPEAVEELRVVDTTTEELQRHKERYQRRKESGYSTFPSVRATTEAEYDISGLVLPTCRYSQWGHSQAGNVIDNTDEQETVDLHLPDVLDALAPSLFLLHRVDYRLDIDAETMEITRL